MTGREVEKRLHCSTKTVNDIVGAGLITDWNPRKEGAKKHRHNYAKRDVDAVARVYRQRMTADQVKEALAKAAAVIHTAHVNAGMGKSASVPVADTRNGIITPLDRIEAAIERLVKVLE